MMDRNSRKGLRKPRESFAKKHTPHLGYYIIVTDTKETEHNYLTGLRDSIPQELQRNLVIKISETNTEDLVQEVLRIFSLHPQYGEPWIIFDRDQVKNFDSIIEEASNAGVKVGWTNPCIEEWFSAYFGTMPTYSDSVSCCAGFSNTFKRVTSQKYEKSDKAIYNKLNRYGNEEKAIKLATQKFKEQASDCTKKPSEMCPCTTVHILVEEIKSKMKQ